MCTLPQTIDNLIIWVYNISRKKELLMSKTEVKEKVVDLLKEVQPQEGKEILAEIIKGIDTEEIKRREERLKKIKDLDELFSNQIKKWQEAGCPEQVMKMFKLLRDAVTGKAYKITPGKGNLPFLLCPGKTLSLYSLMAMVHNNNEVGRVYLLNPNAVTDQIEVPENPYAIFDVEIGKKTLGKSVKTAAKTIRAKGRLEIVNTESIALCIQTDVLKEHSVVATGSRCGGDLSVSSAPSVYIDNGGTPRLEPVTIEEAHFEKGSPSCSSRGFDRQLVVS